MEALKRDGDSEEGIRGVKVPPAVYRDKVAFIQTVREGIRAASSSRPSMPWATTGSCS